MRKEQILAQEPQMVEEEAEELLQVEWGARSTLVGMEVIETLAVAVAVAVREGQMALEQMEDKEGAHPHIQAVVEVEQVAGLLVRPAEQPVEEQGAMGLVAQVVAQVVAAGQMVVQELMAQGLVGAGVVEAHQ